MQNCSVETAAVTSGIGRPTAPWLPRLDSTWVPQPAFRRETSYLRNLRTSQKPRLDENREWWPALRALTLSYRWQSRYVKAILATAESKPMEEPDVHRRTVRTFGGQGWEREGSGKVSGSRAGHGQS